MDREGVQEVVTATGKKAWGKLGRFRYPILILVLGLILMTIPIGDKEEEPTVVVMETQTANPLGDMEEKLEQILSQASGVGRVRVMLQYETSEKTIFQMDTTKEQDTATDSTQTKVASQTVMETSGGTPIVVQTIYPTYSGALIVADGGDNPTVQLNLVNAVSKLTGLGADKITVIKMKSN